MHRPRQNTYDSSCSSVSSIDHGSVTSVTLNQHGFYRKNVFPLEGRQQFMGWQREDRAQWQGNKPTSRGFYGREPKDRVNTGSKTSLAHQFLQRHRTSNLSSQSSFSTSTGSLSTDCDMSHMHTAVSDQGRPDRRDLRDDRLSIPMPLPAEDILMNLGFCQSDHFIPKRFLHDWVDKTRHIQDQHREHVSQQWINDAVDFRLRQMTQEHLPGRSENGFSGDSSNFGGGEFSEDSLLQHKQSSVADDMYGETVSSGNGWQLQKAHELRAVPERNPTLLLGSEHEKLRKKRWERFASQRSRSLATILQEPMDTGAPVKCQDTGGEQGEEMGKGTADDSLGVQGWPEEGDLIIDDLGEGWNQQSSGDVPVEKTETEEGCVAPTEHHWVMKEHQDVKTYKGLTTIISEEEPPRLSHCSLSSTGLPFIVVSSSSSSSLHHSDSLEVDNILNNPQFLAPTKVDDSGFQSIAESLLSVSRNSNLSSTSHSPMTISPVTVIEVDCLDIQEEIRDMDLLVDDAESSVQQTTLVIPDDTCYHDDSSEGASACSTTYYDTEQWLSSSELQYDIESNSKHSKDESSMCRCTSVPAYLPSFEEDEFKYNFPFRDSQQNLCIDVNGLFGESSEEAEHGYGSEGVPDNWSTSDLASDEPTVSDSVTQTPPYWDTAEIALYLSLHVMPYLCGKCQFYIMKVHPSKTSSESLDTWHNNELFPSLYETYSNTSTNARIQSATEPTQIDVTEERFGITNQVKKKRACNVSHSLLDVGNSGASCIHMTVPQDDLGEFNQPGKSAFVQLKKGWKE